jgi:ribonuclease D
MDNAATTNQTGLTARPSYAANHVDYRLAIARRVRERLADRKLARSWEQDMAALAPETVNQASERAVARLMSRLAG